MKKPDENNKVKTSDRIETPEPPQVMDPSSPPDKRSYAKKKEPDAKKDKPKGDEKKNENKTPAPLAPREEL